MKLISMTDFVLEQDEFTDVDKNPVFHFCRCIDYANFLNQSLNLGMFIPCDLEGNPIKSPQSSTIEEMVSLVGKVDGWFGKYKQQYQQAKERVLFEGGFELLSFEHNHRGRQMRVGEYLIRLNNKHIFNLNKNSVDTVEGLVPHDLTIATTAQKQIGR